MPAGLRKRAGRFFFWSHGMADPVIDPGLRDRILDVLRDANCLPDETSKHQATHDKIRAMISELETLRGPDVVTFE